MIKILNNGIITETISQQYAPSSIEILIFNIMLKSEKVFYYNSYDELKFELDLRARIINVSRELYQSKLAFRTFRESKCNTEFWERTNEGGFLLKSDAKPLSAINDIYTNTNLYGTECATAIIIVFYKAVAEIFPENKFNTTFSKIYLMNWKQLDRKLGVKTHSNVQSTIPGDCMYFKNPDVDPLKIEWQGENAIDLSDGLYYGHGIGITTAENIINALNNKRKSGATKSAYLLDTATRLGYKQLAESYF